MNIHEYQAKALISKFGARIPKGEIAFTPQEAKEVAETLAGDVWVVKAQIHAGGRGKAGGVKVVRSAQDVYDTASELLGKVLVTHQTGPQGKEVNRIYVEQGCAIAKEYYLSFLVDRGVSRVTVLASTEGGMDIEEVAEKSPEKIVKFSIDPLIGFMPFHGRKLAYALGFTGAQVNDVVKFSTAIYQAFVQLDASMLEINPMVTTTEGDVMALDAKMSFDDNALFRHSLLKDLRDETEEDPMELKAGQHELSYVKLDGNIGCMVNGAGLAMSTMDIIKLSGGEPANFLDVGGGATRERVTEAFKIILSDPNVQGILVNIFGGIMRCDIIAEGIVHAARDVNINVPLVVRLEGTNVQLGKKILAESGLPIISIDGFSEAAQRIVQEVKEAA
ncbi:Succinyl-CoA ligase [ADP-forming] subunit beta [Candidatus Bealeia paramacronuclearis]|uniref:Succinate--CoA ligase [ADP-forming] subunit beta n=1 Tax=Candidatus Bealeia paramacronuclearis TaxID=1921001 RepID=A0ABZ2C206_9PROT|nr:Succinyl-CoA ligase [ADP-forming] subunit beta [Candidatus Bealeia paramacronuclearis]